MSCTMQLLWVHVCESPDCDIQKNKKIYSSATHIGCPFIVPDPIPSKQFFTNDIPILEIKGWLILWSQSVCSDRTHWQWLSKTLSFCIQGSLKSNNLYVQPTKHRLDMRSSENSWWSCCNDHAWRSVVHQFLSFKHKVRIGVVNAFFQFFCMMVETVGCSSPCKQVRSHNSFYRLM